MELSPLTAVTPIDGRYHQKTKDLYAYFSEYALMKYRVQVEIEYFIALCELPLPMLAGVGQELFPQLRKAYGSFSLADAEAIKKYEATTNHDVKSVEYFVKDHLRKLGLDQYLEFVHFGLTSQDINNTAIPLSLKEGLENVLLPLAQKLVALLDDMAVQWKDVPMLAYTHGQPASPTKLGKEMKVFAYRAATQLTALSALPYPAKFGGATGNFNAHHVAFPHTDWPAFAQDLLQGMGLKRSTYTTQIENYDELAAIFDALKRLNTIFIDFSRDAWQYISMGYFRQRVVKGEVGSSAMPHKVNPIDFENAEGNLGVANALFEHLSAKLPISRLQRDLTDSTVLRNVGVPLAHTLIAFKSLEKGMSKLDLDRSRLAADLERNWAVVAEAIQTILRREGYPNPYETLKDLTRGSQTIDQASIGAFIQNLEVSDSVKAELLKIRPETYTGVY